jgi:putative transposase
MPEEPGQRLAEEKGYEGHFPDKANAKKKQKRKGGRRKVRRWVVEVTHSWLNRFRRWLVRGEKKTSKLLVNLYFACAIYTGPAILRVGQDETFENLW